MYYHMYSIWIRNTSFMCIDCNILIHLINVRRLLNVNHKNQINISLGRIRIFAARPAFSKSFRCMLCYIFVLTV